MDQKKTQQFILDIINAAHRVYRDNHVPTFTFSLSVFRFQRHHHDEKIPLFN